MVSHNPCLKHFATAPSFVTSYSVYFFDPSYVRWDPVSSYEFEGFSELPLKARRSR